MTKAQSRSIGVGGVDLGAKLGRQTGLAVRVGEQSRVVQRCLGPYGEPRVDARTSGHARSVKLLGRDDNGVRLLRLACNAALAAAMRATGSFKLERWRRVIAATC